MGSLTHRTPTATPTTRQERGLRLFEERGEEITHLAAHRWAVPSCSGEELYVVDLRHQSCTCPDYQRRHEACKHQYAALIARAKSGECAGCGARVRRRELHEVGEDHLTFFEGDELCEDCAIGYAVV